MLPATDKTFVIATFVRAIFYGLYLATLIHSLRWLLYKDEGWKVRSVFESLVALAVTLLLFMFSTADIGIALRINLALLSGEKCISIKLELLSITIQVATNLILDAVLMYRCWMVYAKSWRIIVLPLILWPAGIVCIILFDFWVIIELNAPGRLFNPRTRPIATAFFCFTLINNIYATSAISYRILCVAKRNRTSGLYLTSRIFAESGILCVSTTLLMLLTSTFMDGQSLPEILSDTVNFFMMGIAFNLILIRVGKQRANRAYFL